MLPLTLHIVLPKAIRGHWPWLTPYIPTVANLQVLGVSWGPETEHVANFWHVHAFSTSLQYPTSIGAIDPVWSRLLGIVARNRKMHSKARHKSLQKYFSKIFAKVSIQVTEGHHRSNLAKIRISSEMSRCLRNYLGRRPGKKHSIALELFFR